MTGRSKGEGSYFPYKRTGRWCGQITVAGVTRTFYRDTKVECIKLCQAWAADQRKRPKLKVSDVQLGQYIAYWLDHLQRVEPGTIRTYRWAASRLPLTVTTTPLGAVDRRMVQRALADLSGVLGASGVHLVRSVLSHALADALDLGLIAANPASNLRIARGKTPEATAWNMDDCQAFLETADAHPWRAIWWIVAATGLRNGEARALRWEDIDRRTGAVQVRRKLDEDAREVSQPKGHRVRTVAIRGPALRVIQEMPAQRTGYLVADELGQPVTGRILRREFRALMATADVPVIRFHGLRHTAVTQMLRAGVPVHVVAKVAGHSSPAITSKVYAHVLDGDIERAAEAIATTMSGGKRGSETA